MNLTRFDRRSGRFCAAGLVLAGSMQAGMALAQTCATPLSLTDGQSVAGDTCLSSNSLPWFGSGALDGDQKDVVYKFHSDVAQSGSLTFGPGQFSGLDALVLSQCNTLAPIASIYEWPYGGQTWNLPALPAGDNYIVITGGLGGTSNGPAICGAYSFTAQLPNSRPGSCGTPLTYTSGTRKSGDTCAASNSVLDLALGAFYSPQNDLVYHLDPTGIVNHRLFIDSPNFNLTAFVGSTCSGATSAIAEVPAGTSGVLTIPSNLTSTQTLVITANPTGPESACGTFSIGDLEPGIATDAAAFNAALRPGSYLEPFTQAPLNATPLQMDFAGNGYAYRVTPVGAASQLQFVNDTHGNPKALSVTASSTARSMRIAFVGNPVNAFGGRFNVKATSLFAQSGVLTVKVRSGTRTKTYTLRGADDFRGFTSQSRIDEILVSSSATGRLSIDDFIVGFTDTP